MIWKLISHTFTWEDWEGISCTGTDWVVITSREVGVDIDASALLSFCESFIWAGLLSLVFCKKKHQKSINPSESIYIHSIRAINGTLVGAEIYLQM